MQNDFRSRTSDSFFDGSIAGEFNDILTDSTDDAKAEFLRRLHEKGETPDEVTNLAALLRIKSTLSPVPEVSDIVGTGGDGMNTINVSTAASLVLSSLGVRIAKHGNFGATSNKGSADFLKSIGYNFEMNQDELERRLREVSFAFILAPMYNGSFAKFAKARKMLPFKTVFNYLGPLTNPSDPSTMMLGVTDNKISDLYTNYLLLNSKSGCVVYSDDGMDEISPNSPSNINLVRNGKVEGIRFDPAEILGGKIKISEVSRIAADASFELTMAGLNGTNLPAAKFISLNASMGLFVNNRFSSPEEAYAESLKLLKSGYVAEHAKNVTEDSR